MSMDLFVPTAGEPGNPDGALITSFLGEPRVLTPDLFLVATSKPASVTTETDENFGEVYHIHFDEDLTDDERTLAILVAQGNPSMDALLAAGKKAYADNGTWNATTLASINAGANAIISAATTATNTAADKSLANGVKALAAQVADLDNQNRVLIKMAFGLYGL